MMKRRKIVLASSSPRRRELLERAGIDFVVDASNIEEDMRPPERGGAAALVKRLALEKASHVALRHPDAIVIGADTVVNSGRNFWSKPLNARQARFMLRTLSGKSHNIWTGFCIIDTKKGTRVLRAVKTRVTFRPLSRAVIEGYIATGEALKGAGSYTLPYSEGKASGNLFVSDIRGDYNNIIGLPLSAVLLELKKLGVRT